MKGHLHDGDITVGHWERWYFPKMVRTILLFFLNYPMPPQAGKFTFPSLGGIWVKLSGCPDRDNMAEVTLSHFNVEISKDDVVPTWLSLVLGMLAFENSHHDVRKPKPHRKAMWSCSSWQPHLSPTDLWARLWRFWPQPWSCPHWWWVELGQVGLDEASCWVLPLQQGQEQNKHCHCLVCSHLNPLQYHLQKVSLHSFTSKRMEAEWDEVTHARPHKEMGLELRYHWH